MEKNDEPEPNSDELATIFYNNGHYYGYPFCCINEFILKRLVLNDNRLPIISQNGFVPCETHSKQILDNLISIKDLIKNRICEFEFPQDSADEDIEEEVKEDIKEDEKQDVQEDNKEEDFEII